MLAIVSILGACSTAPNASGSLTSSGFYRVAPGDTLYGIARKFGRTVPALVRMNGLKDGDEIKVGELLRVGSDVKAATASASASVKHAQGSTANKAAPVEDVGPVPRDWIWPADGAQTAAVGARKGIDIAGRSGQDVRAANAGSVSFVGGGIRGYGNLVIIKHSGNLLSVYAHNKTVLVKEGQAVSKGQKIAEMGNSDANSVKLYFEIRRNGRPVDPVAYLPKR